MLNKLLKKNGLECVDMRQYSMLFPGFISLLPDSLLYKYHSLVRKTPMLSAMGTDFIISFKKVK